MFNHSTFQVDKKIKTVKKELIIRSNSDTVDFAMLNDGKLVELDKEIGKNKFAVGDIFVAKIRKVIPGLNAAFVNVNSEKDGFLHYHDLGPKLLSLTKFAKLVESKKIKSFSFNKGIRLSKSLSAPLTFLSLAI